jgi:hypothetical protein
MFSQYLAALGVYLGSEKLAYLVIALIVAHLLAIVSFRRQ